MNLRSTVLQLLTEDRLRAQILRFLISGGTNTIATYLYFLAIYWTFDTPFWAFTISFVLGIMTSYLLNLKFTFQQRHKTKKMLAFPAIYLFHYLLGLSLFKLWLHIGIAAEIAFLLNAMLLAPIVFLLMRFILRDRPAANPPC